MDVATREYHKLVQKVHTWFLTPGSKDANYPIKYGGYDRDDILNENPNAKDIIELSNYAIPIDSQDESCHKGHMQRPYVNLMILDIYAKQLVEYLENHPHIVVFTGPASHTLRYANAKGRHALSGDDVYFNLTKTNVKNYTEKQKRDPHIYRKEKIKNGYLQNTNILLNNPDRSADPQWNELPNPINKYKEHVWFADIVWDKYCEKGSTKKFLTTLVTVLKTIQDDTTSSEESSFSEESDSD
jgi:hypothetical protein